MARKCKDFRAWFKRNLREYASDIAGHGADCGYPHITYNTDAAAVFDQYASEIWAMLADDADDQGESNAAALLASFRRADMLCDWTTTRTLLVWYACEKVAREMTEER